MTQTLDTVLIFIFFVMYFLRMVYDLEIGRDSLSVTYAYKLEQQTFSALRFQTYIYVIFLTITKLYVLSKCLKYVNVDMGLIYIAIWGIISILLSQTVSSISLEQDTRLDGSITLKSISYATYIGVVLIASSYYFFKKRGTLQYIIYFVICLVFIRIMFLTASRGPILSIVICFFVYRVLLFLKRKRFNFLVFNLLIFLSCLASYILGYIQNILIVYFPIFYNRLDRDNRSMVYETFISELKNHLFFGFQLDFLGYSHNMILDSFVMFGIVGGLIVPLICLRFLYCSLKYIKLYNMHLFLVLLHFAICNMFSGALGVNLGFWSAYLVFAYSISSRLSNTSLPSAEESNDTNSIGNMMTARNCSV